MVVHVEHNFVSLKVGKYRVYWSVTWFRAAELKSVLACSFSVVDIWEVKQVAWYSAGTIARKAVEKNTVASYISIFCNLSSALYLIST